MLSLLASIFLLAESKQVVNFEQQQQTELQQQNKNNTTESKNMPLKEGEIEIKESDSLKPSEVCSIFIKTSFQDKSLIMCCVAGLMINFLTAFAWGIQTKWLKTWGNPPNWTPLSKEQTAQVIFLYGITKGCLQFASGFVSDMIGRRYTVGAGLVLCSISIFAFALIGATATTQSGVYTGFCVCSLLLGTGTAVMYPNVIAAAAQHAEPKSRSLVIGT